MDYTEDYIDVKQYWLILRRRWFPAAIVFGSVVTLTALMTFLQKPVYQASGKLLLKKQSGTALTNIEGLGGLEALTQKSSPLETEAEIIRSDPILHKVINILDLKSKNGEPVKAATFLKSLDVSNIKGTDMLSISFKSTNPQEAATVVNQIMQVYLNSNVVSNRAEATATRSFIDQQLPKAEADVKKLEIALRQFKERYGTIALSEEAKVAVEADGALKQQIATLQSQIQAAAIRSQTLQSQLRLNPQQGIALNALSQSPAVQQTLTQYQEVQSQLVTARKQLQPQHPELQDLEDKYSALQALLSQQIGQVVGASAQPQPSRIPSGGSGNQNNLTGLLVEAEINRLGLTNQLASLINTQSTYQRRIGVLPKLEQRQRELERKLTVAQSTYEALLKSLQETQIKENQNIGNARTIANALVPETPIAPRKTRNLAMGIVLGSLLGIGTALLLEALDNSIKTVKEAKELFDYTVLATLPLLDRSEEIQLNGLERTTPKLILRDRPRSALSEAYRMLQANLKFLSSDQPIKSIAMTSSVPREGKSTVTANLALALAEMGHRVLVVDADLRRPIQHQIWELPNSVGLSNVLAEHSHWQEHIRPEAETLDILPSGIVPPNPGPLLDSRRMSALLQEFKRAYDYVLIDTPPLAVAADALILGQQLDGILMVNRPGVVTTGSAESAKEALAKANQRVLGLVINGVVPENEPDSYYYYYAKDYYGENIQSLRDADINHGERNQASETTHL